MTRECDLFSETQRNVPRHYGRHWPQRSPGETPPCLALLPGPDPRSNPADALQLPQLPGDQSTQADGQTGQLDPHEGIPRSGIEAVAVLVPKNLNLQRRNIDPVVGIAPIHSILR